MFSSGLLHMQEITYILIFKRIHMLLTKTRLDIFYNTPLLLLLCDHLFSPPCKLHNSQLCIFKKLGWICINFMMYSRTTLKKCKSLKITHIDLFFLALFSFFFQIVDYSFPMNGILYNDIYCFPGKYFIFLRREVRVKGNGPEPTSKTVLRQ